jgi:hypothetical protein
VATMTEEERAVWQRHFEWVDGLFADGSLVKNCFTSWTRSDEWREVLEDGPYNQAR